MTRGTPAAFAAKRATGSVPVGMAGLGEPLLVVASLSRPGGIITGSSGVQPELEPKRMELLKEIAPTGLAALLNLGNPVTARWLKELHEAAQAMRWRFRLFDVRNGENIQQAFRTLDKSSGAIVVGLEVVTQAHRKMIAELAVNHQLPAIYGDREFGSSGD